MDISKERLRVPQEQRLWRIWHLVGPIFGASTSGQDLPGLARQLTAVVIAHLLPALRPEALSRIRSAIDFLYPLETSHQKESASPQNWREVAPLLRLWATLVCDDTQAAILALSQGDWGRVDNRLTNNQTPMPFDDDLRLRFIEEEFELLRQSYNDALPIILGKQKKPVIQLSNKEIDWIACQRKKPAPFSPTYDLAYNRILLAVDPVCDIDEILLKIKSQIEEHQREISSSHEDSFSDEARSFLGSEFIKAFSPLAESKYSQNGYNGTSEQEFLERNSEALLVYELRKTMNQKEVKQFFPHWPNNSGPDSRPAATLCSRRSKDAKTLIRKARLGAISI